MTDYEENGKIESVEVTEPKTEDAEIKELKIALQRERSDNAVLREIIVRLSGKITGVIQ